MTPRFQNLVDPRPAHLRSRPLRNGAILFALIGLAIYMALTHNIPIINGKPGERLRADFAFVNQVLAGQTPVRVNGVPVGIVDNVGAGPDPRRSSRVEMRITDDNVVVHADARAEIRWRTLLGGRMYIDLEPGSSGERRVDDWVIPVARTTSQVEFDDLLQPYDGGTEQAQRDIFRGLSGTLKQPATTRGAIEALPALETVGRGEEPVLGTDTGDLRKLVAATATTVEALGADTTGLQRLVTGARQTLGATNARRSELGQFLEESPPSLDETLSTMARLRITLGHLDPLVDNLRPGARELAGAADAAKPALAEADGLLRELRPVLRDTRPTFDDLGATADAAVPVINGLKPTVNRLNSQILPWLRQRDDEEKLRNYEAIGPFFSVLNMAAAEYDSIGYRLHLSTPGGNNTLITAAQAMFARSCDARAVNARQRVGCARMASVLAHGWLGRGRAK
jgi:virulence factor Mce-like protein